MSRRPKSSVEVSIDVARGFTYMAVGLISGFGTVALVLWWVISKLLG